MFEEYFSAPEFLIEKVLCLSFCFIPLTLLHSLFFSKEEIEGSPAFTWAATLPVHTILFPSLVAASYMANPHNSTYDWFLTDWDSSGRPYEQFYLCAFLGHMAKDFIVASMSPTIILHHVVSMSLALSFLIGNNSPATFCFATTAVELGSATHTLFILYPRNRKVLYLFKYGMTLSNTVCLAVIVFFLKEKYWTIDRMILAIVSSLLCAGRQQTMIEKCKNWCKDLKND